MSLQRLAGNAATTQWLEGMALQRSPASELQKKYSITIEKGNKDWSDSEVQDLKAALGKLDAAEAQKLTGYHFIRWTNAVDRLKLDPTYKDFGKGECGLHELSLATPEVDKISMYDGCWGDPEAKSETMAGLPIGQASLLHEIGHAMAFAEYRKAWEDVDRATKAYNQAIDEYNAADSAKAQAKLQPKVDRLDKAMQDANDRLTAAKGRAQSELAELLAGKPALTEYSKTDPDEALADAFVIYKGDPAGLKKVNPKLFNWFARHGEWTPAKATTPPAKKSK